MKKIKAAEKQANDKSEEAKKEAATIVMNAKIESSHIIDNAENDGRCDHKKAVDEFRQKSNTQRALRIKEAEESGKNLEATSSSRFPRLMEKISEIFDSEFDVKI